LKGQNMETQTAATLPDSGNASIPLAYLLDSGFNYRREYDKQKMEELISSVKAHGIIENLILRPVWDVPDPDPNLGRGRVIAYQVICGNRRWRAAKAAGLTEVPATIRDITDEQAAEIILIENLQREDVHPLEECEAFAELAKRYDDLKVLAGRVGKTPSYVKRILQLNRLIDAGKKAFRAGEITLEHAFEIARLADAEQQKITLKECVGTWHGLMTLRELREFIQRQFHLTLAKAPFSTEDEGLIAEAGPCTTCQKRTGANVLLFPDIKQQDTCTDPKCFRAKIDAHILNTKQIWLCDHPDQPLVELSTSYGKPRKGVLARDEFEVVEGLAAKAPGVKAGIIVDGEGIGKVVTYVNSGRGTAAAAAMPITERRLALQQKERELETKQRNEEDIVAILHLMSAVRALQCDPKVLKGNPLTEAQPLTVEELVLVAQECVARCHHDMLKRYCDGIFGLGHVVVNQYGGRDYSSAVEKRAKELVKDPASLAVFLLELMLFSHIGRIREKSQYGEGNLIYRIAKTRGVQFKEVFAPIEEVYSIRKQRAAARLGLGESPDKGKTRAKKETAPLKAGPKKGKAATGSKKAAKKTKR
jgi:ParB/RepB/Spo0J family partition protein